MKVEKVETESAVESEINEWNFTAGVVNMFNISKNINPHSTYKVSVRAATSIGFGQFTNAIEITTNQSGMLLSLFFI